MKRLNIDLERAVHSISEEGARENQGKKIDVLLHASSNLFRGSKLEASGSVSQEPAGETEFLLKNNFSSDLRSFSLNLSEYGSKNFSSDKPEPPPRPARLKTFDLTESNVWPPQLSPDELLTVFPPLLDSDSNDYAKLKKDTLPYEIHTWSKFSHLPLPPPEQKRTTISEDSISIHETNEMILEDWRSHIVRLEEAELEVLRDIDRFERKLKDVEVDLITISKSSKHRSTVQADSRKFIDLKASSNKKGNRRLPIADSYRFSVRSHSKAPYSANE